MKKVQSVGGQIVGLRKDLGMTQLELAKSIKVGQPQVSAWEGERDSPSPGAYLRLGTLAPKPEQKIFFWKLAGLDEQSIVAAAHHISKGRVAPPMEGEIIRVPRYRETLEGRRDAGPPVPLPVEFVPNPTATICLEVSGPSSIVDAPHGLFVLDTSAAGTANVLVLQERVVMVDAPQLPGTRHPAGLYVGRLRLQQSQHARRPDWAWLGVLLMSLTDFSESLQLGSYENTEVMQGVAWEDSNERDRRLREMWRRVGSNFPLAERVRILGRVIGRLTGHLEAGGHDKK